jgi:hypothetical protein
MAEPWVAPDAPSEPALLRPPVATIRPAGADRSGAGTRNRAPGVPVPLRPMSTADLLDGSMRIVKLAPRTVLGLAAVFVVPGQLLLALVTRDRLGDSGTATVFQTIFTGDSTTGESLSFDLFSLAFLLQGIALACVCAGVSQLVSAWYVGQDRTLPELVRSVLRRLWVLVVAWLLVHVVEGVGGLLIGVGAILPFTWYAVVSPVIACETANPWRALGRSYSLTKRRFGAVFGTGLCVFLVDVMLSFGLGAIGTTYAGFDLPAAWVVTVTVSVAALLVTVPFVAGVSTLLYLDLRVRTEGLDISLATTRRFARAAP